MFIILKSLNLLYKFGIKKQSYVKIQITNNSDDKYFIFCKNNKDDRVQEILNSWKNIFTLRHFVPHI